ncbi:Protein ArsC [Candidatus Sulfopaludibacter sp. SbA3]|nr:Protein ArsC [Candidatus Sulfopaludibacter sp. SbA3]
MIKTKVLFLCSANSCRTQMAEALLRDLGGDRFEVASGGAEVTPLDPEAIQAMREIGIEISRQAPKDVSLFLGQRFSYVISLCDRKKEPSCPIFPGAIWRLHWAIDNPDLAPTLEERRKVVRRVRDEIREKVSEFVANA